MYLVIIPLFTIIALGVAFSLHAFAEKEDVGILTTKFGNIVISFRNDVAPKTVANFENLTKSGFYDGTIFYRITPGFIIQGGDPNTKNGSRNTWGNGDAGYTIPPEVSNLKHTKYMVSMAHRAADINSASSQFFIVLGNAPWLDGKYTIFGEVISGQDVVDKIASIKTDPKTNQPLDPDEARITKAAISSQEKIQSIQSGQLTNSSGGALQEQTGQGIVAKQPSQDMLVTFGSIAAVIIVATIVSIISIKLKNRSKRTIDMESRQKEKIANQIQIESAKKELTDMNSKMYDAKSELSSLQSQNETKKKEIILVKNELEAAKIEIFELNSENKHVLTEIQLVKDNLYTIKTQYDQIEVELIKEKNKPVKKELTEINPEKSKLVTECETLQNQIEYAKKEFTDMNSKMYDAKSELSSLQSQNESKKKEIILVKNELVSIEKELFSVGKKDDTKKTVEAAGAIAASINSKYEATKKEIELLRATHTILKIEFENLIIELNSLKIKDKYLK
jgi:cyclophilin family peptidyl-prolyl cis-trans isomerase